MSELEPTPAAPPRPRINRRALRVLREPIPAHNIGKKPRVYCWACNRAAEERPGRACEDHVVRWCDTCRSSVSNAHEHDDYVGHAEATDRFLEADLTWNWRPMALDERGLPQFDDDGGMWIYLTIGGVERLGYGHANGKTGGSAIAEAISNALKNVGQRFGVGLDQRAQTDLHAKEVDARQSGTAALDTDAPPAEPRYADPNWIARVGSLLGSKRGVYGEDRPHELSEILQREVDDVAHLSPEEARRVVRILSGGPDPHPPATAAAADPDPAAATPAAATPPAESAPVHEPEPEPEPESLPAPHRATPGKRTPKPSTSRPGRKPAAPGLNDAHVRTIDSLLSSRGVPERDTTARLGIISTALARPVESMDDLSYADAEVLIRKLGSGEASVDPPPPAAAAAPDTEPERGVFDGLCKQIAQAITEEDAHLIKVEIGKALMTNTITKADGGALSERLEKRGRQVGLGGTS